jgi:hypothetical protein
MLHEARIRPGLGEASNRTQLRLQRVLSDAHRVNLEGKGLSADIIPVPACEASVAGTDADPFVVVTTWPAPMA